jgi:hypothetical protein
MEALGFDMQTKRIKLIEETVMARKRLIDEGVPKDDVYAMLPMPGSE